MNKQILLRPELYTYRVGEVSFVDWLAQLAAGNTVENVHCEDCAAAELTEDESSESTAGAS